MSSLLDCRRTGGSCSLEAHSKQLSPEPLDAAFIVGSGANLPRSEVQTGSIVSGFLFQRPWQNISGYFMMAARDTGGGTISRYVKTTRPATSAVH